MSKRLKCTVTSSKQIPCDFHEATPVSDWLVFCSSMARTKTMSRKDEMGKTRRVRMRAEVNAVLAEPPVPLRRPLQPQTRWRGGGQKQVGWRDGEIAGVVSNPTVGPDGHRGWAINVRWGGAGLKETLTDCGRQGSPEWIPEGQESKEAPEVPAGDGDSLQDLWVSKEHWAPNTQAPPIGD